MSNKLNKSRAAYMKEYRQKKKQQQQPEEDIERQRNKFEMSAKRLAAIERMKKARQAKLNKKVIEDDDEDTDSESNYPQQQSKEVIDLTMDDEEEEDEEDRNMEEVTKIVKQQQDDEIKKDSQLLQMDDNITDFKNYMETNGIVEHIKDLENELKLTRDLLEKTNETLKLVTMSNMKKSKKIKRLKKTSFDPEDKHELFENMKYHNIDPSDEAIQEVTDKFDTTLTKEDYEDLKKMLEDYSQEFHKRYKSYHNLTEKQ